MGKVIAFGETAVGVGLILGAFVGIAAVGGAFMNLNFMLAGSASTNPVMLLLGFLLVLAVEDRRLHRSRSIPSAAAGHPLARQQGRQVRAPSGDRAAHRARLM